MMCLGDKHGVACASAALDGTLSPMMNEDLVLCFGPITYDSWNGREQTANSRGGANWVALGLVSPTSAQRLVVVIVLHVQSIKYDV